ncbi:docking protein 1 isoform X1 [Zootoca vivipara]|uniref:docking protein 1 isoform X1 n=1 Tax=Zootoca vivipara TaxID=8524 RepID=UPI00293BBF37|nr:docking protein 1 isoform X1 [Zootoca vivipara]
MDPPVKAGPLLLQQPSGLRIGAKRWKKSWFVLYPASPHGVARLEFFDGKEGPVPAERVGTRRLDKKIVRLADCVSVAPAPDGSPKEGLSAFRLETNERSYLFAAEPHEVADWVARLCEAAFLQGNPGKAAANCAGGRPLEMAMNAIYYSREEVSEFWVTVQKTEAAERCKLQGVYVLKASGEGLVLGDPHSNQPLFTWPYRLLRRYGRDKVMFSFEAGRRCESGPGNFTFETKQGNEIFHVVEAAIQAQKAQVVEHRHSTCSLDAEVGQLPGALASSLSLEGESLVPALAPERHSLRPALAAKLSAATAAEEEEVVAPAKGLGLRDPLAKWPSTPPRSPLPEVPGHPLPPEDAGNVYSEPLDALRASRPRLDTLYAEPVDSRREGGKERCPPQDKLLYEEVGPGGGQDRQSDKVHIYDEPEGRAQWPAPTPTAIYDEACLPCEAWRTQGMESPAGYELPCLLGTGEYSVPAFPLKQGFSKPPKPCPAPKPPRPHKKPPQPGAPRPAPGNSNNNNSGCGAEEPLYSKVVKPPLASFGRSGGSSREEQSVDESRPASVYEDLGEI